MTPPLYLGETGNEHAAGAIGGIINGLTRLWASCFFMCTVPFVLPEMRHDMFYEARDGHLTQ